MTVRVTDQAVVVESKPCPVCRTRSIIMLPYKGWAAWFLDGKLIQDALPDLTAAERELLITGTCESCWDSIFADHEDFEE